MWGQAEANSSVQFPRFANFVLAGLLRGSVVTGGWAVWKMRSQMGIWTNSHTHTLDKKWIIEVIRRELNPITCN